MEAGYNATCSNTLYIVNSSKTLPPIYGEFDTKVVEINGNLHDTDPSDPRTVVLTLADGACHNASNRTLKKEIAALNEKEALEAFEKLQPVTYIHKSRSNDPQMGFIAEAAPD